jgi:hypothetical protein
MVGSDDFRPFGSGRSHGTGHNEAMAAETSAAGTGRQITANIYRSIRFEAFKIWRQRQPVNTLPDRDSMRLLASCRPTKVNVTTPGWT